MYNVQCRWSSWWLNMDVASSTVHSFLCFQPQPVPFCLSQKQLTQDDDADEVEVAIDNTAFMDEFFSEVGDLPVLFF